jgi:hypothetical protein
MAMVLTVVTSVPIPMSDVPLGPRSSYCPGCGRQCCPPHCLL